MIGLQTASTSFCLSLNSSTCKEEKTIKEKSPQNGRDDPREPLTFYDPPEASHMISNPKIEPTCGQTGYKFDPT
jgi:hypothetical protein